MLHAHDGRRGEVYEPSILSWLRGGVPARLSQARESSGSEREVQVMDKDGAKTSEPDDNKTKIQESLKKFLIALGRWADATEAEKE